MQVQINGTWFLRGIFNTALKSIDASLPCSNHYVLSFIDTAAHVEFISTYATLTQANSPNDLKSNPFSKYRTQLFCINDAKKSHISSVQLSDLRTSSEGCPHAFNYRSNTCFGQRISMARGAVPRNRRNATAQLRVWWIFDFKALGSDR
jgi:hypothetical protein